MSTEATTPSKAAPSIDAPTASGNGTPNKGKGKTVDESMDEDDEEDEDEDDVEEEDDGEEEDDYQEINPSAIISGSRRTRGIKIDYASEEALAKAGLKPETADEDEGGDSFVAPDDEMHDD
ncbi:hypothetical protein OF83DRAFT_1126408 [Amylostereum chailletii]|nr:hypothetical protein OF83DRAFT_1126408 [Amylostereum chailletii]